MKNPPLFYVLDKKHDRWMLQRGPKEKCRSLQQYLREKWFKVGRLMWCDLEGFRLDDKGELYLVDECGGEMYLPNDRFQVCFPTDMIKELPESTNKTYLYLK